MAFRAVMDGGVAPPSRVVGVPYFEITGTGTLTAQGQTMVDAYRTADLASQGGAMALGLYAAFQTLKNWHDVKHSFTTVGAIARDPRVQISSALLDVAAGLRAFHNVPGSMQFTSGVSQQLFSRMFASGADRFFSHTSVAAQARTGLQATSRGMLHVCTVPYVWDFDPGWGRASLRVSCRPLPDCPLPWIARGSQTALRDTWTAQRYFAT